MDWAVRFPVPTLILLTALLAGAVMLGYHMPRVRRKFGKGKMNSGRPVWPRDWPKATELFTSNRVDPTVPGYLDLSPREALGSGAMPLGRTYPTRSIFPDIFPLRELRRRVQFASSRSVWVPKSKRLQHFFVLGATGKGKSTSYAIPIVAYGSWEQNTGYFVIDVKSPQFVRLFAGLYKQQGKDVVFFDPWSLDETLAFEPLWRANDERKSIIADVIASYSSAAGQSSSSDNSEFFKEASIRTLRGLVDLAQFWPRRHCNLPAVQQLVGAGGNCMKEAFEKAHLLMPSLDELLAAIEVVLDATPEELRDRGRDEVTEGALAVLDRSGYRLAYLVKRMRGYREQQGGDKARSEEEFAELERAFWAEVKQEWVDRKTQLQAIVMNMGEFINMPDDTRNSVVSTLANKVSWFRDPNIARAFSRDEIDVRVLITKPVLFLVGAPMAKLKVGSLFVSALLSNLALNAVYQRGMAIERREKGVSKHEIFFMLDEFPQLKIREAPSILATFRGYLSGLVMVFQERGQLRQLYNDDATTMEGNTVHKILLTGAHEETAEFYATKAIGEVSIVKESESGIEGEKQNISRSIESVPLVTTTEVKEGRLNGSVMPGLAWSVGSDVPAFPIRPLPFYEDPTLRRLLRCKRRINKKGRKGETTWRFWEWTERWEPEEGPAYLERSRQLTPQERASGAQDPVWERAQDPYTQYLDYLLGDAKHVYDELQYPKLQLADIGVTENDPSAAAMAAAQATPAPGAGAGGRQAQAGLPAPLLVQTYGLDIRKILADDFRPLQMVPEHAPLIGTVDVRLATYQTLAEHGVFNEEAGEGVADSASGYEDDHFGDRVSDEDDDYYLDEEDEDEL